MLGSKRGDSPIPLVFFIVLTLLMGAATYQEYDNYNRESRNLDEKEAHKMPPGKDAEILQQEQKAYDDQIDGLSNIMGFGFQLGRGENIAVASIRDTLTKIKKERDPENRVKYPSLYGRADFTDDQDIPTTLTLNLQVTLEALNLRVHELQQQNIIIASDIEKTQNYLDEENSQAEDRKTALDDRISKLEAEITEINEKKAKMIEKLEQEKQEAFTLARTSKDQIEDEKKKNKQVLSRLRSRLSSQRQEIKILIRQRKIGRRPDKISSEKTPKLFKSEAFEEPDGEIVYSDPTTHVTHINIGSRQNVVKGLKFVVFRYGEERKIRYKGKVEVVRVDEDMSRVAIIDEVDSYDPVVTGDLLLNPIWDARNPRYIAFAGSTFGGRFTQKDLLRYCNDVGAKVEVDEKGNPIVTVQTHILVAGGQGSAGALQTAKTEKKEGDGEDEEPAPKTSATEEEKKEFWWLSEDPNFKKAVEMGLEIIRDTEFMQYVGD